MKPITEESGIVMKKSDGRPRKKPGAKPKGPYEQKIRTLTTRITERTRIKLENAASMSGRSLSQEIELRLNRSLDQDDVRYQDFGGENQYRMCRIFADIANSIKLGAFAEEGRDWTNSKGLFAAALAAWKAVIEKMLREDIMFKILPADEIEKFGAKIGSEFETKLRKKIGKAQSSE